MNRRSGLEDVEERRSPLPLLGRRLPYALLVVGIGLFSACCLPAPIESVLHAIRSESLGALYVVNLVVLAGSSAGAIVVGALAGASRASRAWPVVRAAEAAGTVTFVLATTFLLLALLRPWTVWGITGTGAALLSSSGLAVVALYVGNAIALGYFAVRHDRLRWLRRLPRARSAGDVAALARLALGAPARPEPGLVGSLVAVLVPAAVLLHVVPAWMLPVLGLAPGWATIGVAAAFYVSTLISGLAVVVLATVAGRALRALAVEDPLLRGLGSTLGLAAPVLGFCLLIETQAMIGARGPAGPHLFHEIVAGPYAPVFWFAQAAGVVAPLLLLALPRVVTPRRLGASAVLVLLGVLAERWMLLVPPLFGHAHALYASGGYHAGAGEVAATLAVYAAAVALGRPLGRVLIASGRG